MIGKNPDPGVSRTSRISNEGLQRLDAQLLRGDGISTQVLAQWIKRYGDDARQLIKQHQQWRSELDDVV